MVTEEMAIPTDRETADNIEHLVREIVANASRHSESRKVDLGIAMREDMLILSLQDYGEESPQNGTWRAPTPWRRDPSNIG